MTVDNISDVQRLITEIAIEFNVEKRKADPSGTSPILYEAEKLIFRTTNTARSLSHEDEPEKVQAGLGKMTGLPKGLREIGMILDEHSEFYRLLLVFNRTVIHAALDSG